MKVKSILLTGKQVVKPALRFTVSFEKPPPTENYFLGDGIFPKVTWLVSQGFNKAF